MVRGRFGVWAAAALAPVAFLAFDPGGWYPFGPAKWLAVSVLVPLAALQVVRRGSVHVDRRLAIAVGVLLGVLALAACFGADPTYAWIGTPERELGVLTWVLCAGALVVGASLDADTDVPAVLIGLVVAAVGVGGVAGAEALGLEAGPIGHGASRLTGTFGSSAYLGAAAGLLVPIAVGIACDAGLGRALRRGAAAGAVLCLVAVLGAGERAAWVGLVAAGVAVAVARRAWLRAHLQGVAVAAALGVVALGVLAVATPVGHRAHSVTDADAPGGRGRIDEWRVATRVLARHPVLGVGPEGYRTAFAEGVDARYERAHGRDPLPDRAHSGPLDVALAGGFGALAAWLAVIGLVGLAAWRALRRGPPWLVGLAAGLVAYEVGELFLFPTMELEPVAWLLAGVLVVAAPVFVTTDDGRPTGARPVGRAGVRRPFVAVLGTLVVVASLGGLVGLAADRAAAAAADALARGDGAKAERDARTATRWRPDVVRYHLLEARARVADGLGIVDGIAAADDALRVSPRDPIAQRERARLLVARARATQVPAHAQAARRYLTGLLAHDRANATLSLLAGEAAQLDGDDRGAERAWLRAEDLAPRQADASTDLALLYLAQHRSADARAAIDRAVERRPHDDRVLRVAARVRRR